MSDFILKSSINKVNYDREIVFENKGNEILKIKIIDKSYFRELSFYIIDFWKIWYHSKKIAKLIVTLSDSAVVTECLNREYVLRVWLWYTGFQKKVSIPDYYRIKNKKYSYLIYKFKN